MTDLTTTTCWTYNRITVEDDLGNGYVNRESYYEMKTDGGAYKVKIEKLVGVGGSISLYGWFVWITHHENSADVEVYTNFRSAWSSGFGTLKEAKRFGTNWVHEAIQLDAK
jgi:hypothetical protein|tara:strand:- start:5602 stop:5934 length:333 start_codon:yes stop_codon:yes gene_type:complete